MLGGISKNGGCIGRRRKACIPHVARSRGHWIRAKLFGCSSKARWLRRRNRDWFRFPAHLVKDPGESRHRQWIEARHGSLLQLNLLYIESVIYDYPFYDLRKVSLLFESLKLIIKIKVKMHIYKEFTPHLSIL